MAQAADTQAGLTAVLSAYAIDSAGDLFFGLFVATIAVPLARVGLAGRWFTRFAIFTGVLYALGSLSITSPDAGVFGACEVIGTLLLLAWVAITSVRLLRTRPGSEVTFPNAKAEPESTRMSGRLDRRVEAPMSRRACVMPVRAHRAVVRTVYPMAWVGLFHAGNIRTKRFASRASP